MWILTFMPYAHIVGFQKRICYVLLARNAGRTHAERLCASVQTAQSRGKGGVYAACGKKGDGSCEVFLHRPAGMAYLRGKHTSEAMKKLHIVTPVKDSIETSLDTIRAVMASAIDVPHTYTVYNDFSTPENTERLKEEAEVLGFRLVNLSDVTSHPSPNYLLVLRTAQREALAEDAAVCIVESDVTVRPDTLQRLYEGAQEREGCGIAAAVTVDEAGEVNYPYLYAKDFRSSVEEVRKHCSFCCSLLTPALLKAYSFSQLDETKNWYDVTISHESLRLGLHNYLFMELPVTHRPHQSRPWKQLKYKNPLKYYWLKYTKGLDKI